VGGKSLRDALKDELSKMGDFTREEARQAYIRLGGRDPSAMPKYWGSENVGNILSQIADNIGKRGRQSVWRLKGGPPLDRPDGEPNPGYRVIKKGGGDANETE
jgi:hypothetical protein